MAHPSQDRTLVLHGLRLNGFAETDVVAMTAGREDVTVVRLLEALGEEGLVTRKQGIEVSGWVLTPAGRAELGRRLADELEAAGGRRTVEAVYDRFAALNPELLQLCTDWQLKPAGAGEVNDHSDPEYDRAVIERLVELHQRAEPAIAPLGALLDRFASYPRRLGEAAARVVAGDPDWFTRPVMDSYHTVWFELHEDLLATLGRERAEAA
jgi:hypothetical protein